MDDSLKHPETFSEDQLISMREQGLERPEAISYSRWKAPRSQGIPYHPIVILAAADVKTEAIAELLQISINIVAVYLNEETIRQEIAMIQKTLMRKETNPRFLSLVPKAIDVAEEVMQDDNQKAAIRLAAAQLIMERALGRPTQQVDLGGSLIRTLFERLDAKEVEQMQPVYEPKIIRSPLLIQGIVKDNELIVDVVTDNEQPIEKEQETNDAIDSWIKNHLGKDLKS